MITTLIYYYYYYYYYMIHKEIKFRKGVILRAPAHAMNERDAI
jgi:hypothetical protein